MNVFNKALFHLVLSPKALYRRLGIQTDKLSLILQVKLMMDDRRPNTFNQHQQKQQKQKEYSRSSFWGIIGYAFMGLFFLYAFLLSEERLLQLTLYFSLYIVLLAMVLITEVSTLLLDGKDNTIILPAPVNAATLLMARLLHILVIILRSGLPMMLAAWVTTSILDGWKAALLFPWICLLAILLVVFLVNSFYLFILRIVSVERFKNIITSVQIAFSIVIFATYQLLPRIINRHSMEGVSFQSVRWSIYFPSQWFAALYDLVVQSHTGQLVVTGAVIAFLLPLAAFYILIRFLAPAFNRKIGMLAGGEPPKPLTSRQKVQRKTGKSLANVLSVKLTRHTTEQAAFRLAWNISSRSRDFKMKVYPSIGYQLVYLLIIFVSGTGQSLSLEGFRQMEQEAFTLILALIYLSSFSINTIITQMQQSEKYKAGWVFFTTPLLQPGQVISGAYKAMIARFFGPTLLIVSVASMILTGGKIALHLLTGFSTVLMCCTLFGYLFLRKFPFSMPVQTSNKAGNILLGILVTFLPFLMGGVHYFLKDYPLVLLGMGLLALVIHLWLLRLMQQRAWHSILSRYTEA